MRPPVNGMNGQTTSPGEGPRQPRSPGTRSDYQGPDPFGKRTLAAILLVFLMLLPAVAFFAYRAGSEAEREALLKDATLLVQTENAWPEALRER